MHFPLFPRRDIEKIPFFLAYLKTFKIFFDFPEVDITINKSLNQAHLDFLKTVYQIPGHFHKLVIVDVSSAKLTTGRGLRLIFGLNLTKNSAERCCASAAEPPLPHKKFFHPFKC